MTTLPQSDVKPLRAPMTLKEVKSIAVHSTATPPSFTNETFDWLWGIHVENNGWSHIGYHFAIPRHSPDLIPCRPLKYTGAGVKGHNSDTIHVVYFGGVAESHGKPEDNITPDQEKRLAVLVQTLIDEHGLTWSDVKGHRDFEGAKTACPSFDVAERIPSWIELAKTSGKPKDTPHETELDKLQRLLSRLFDTN